MTLKNDSGIIFDSIILDWLLYLSLFLILIGIGYLIRWYYHAKAKDHIADYTTKTTPAFTRRRSLERRRSRRHSSLRSSVYSNQSGKLSYRVPI